jgi:hypothetical protein
MSRAQQIVLRRLVRSEGALEGYCDLLAETGLNNYRAVDWVLDALERRGFIAKNEHGDGYDVMDAGRAALASAYKVR